VPRGTKDTVLFPDDDFDSVSSALQCATFSNADFASTLKQAKTGDFVFVDPPYTVRHNANGFVKYNQKIFSWTDQIRLRDLILEASQRGVMCLVTNANHPSIVKLYEGLGDCIVLSRHSVVSGSSEFRGRYSELAITIGYAKGNASIGGEQPTVSRTFALETNGMAMTRSINFPSKRSMP
jgi:DNA adenine methylase